MLEFQDSSIYEDVDFYRKLYNIFYNKYKFNKIKQVERRKNKILQTYPVEKWKN